MKHFYEDNWNENKIIITKLFEPIWFDCTPISIIFVIFLAIMFRSLRCGFFTQFKDVVELLFQFSIAATLYYTAIQIHQQDRSHKMQKDVELFEKRGELRQFFTRLKFYYSREYKRYLSGSDAGVRYSLKEFLDFSTAFVSKFDSCNLSQDDLDSWQKFDGSNEDEIKLLLKVLDANIESLYKLIGYFWETRYVVGLDEINVEFLDELVSCMYAYKDCIAKCYDEIRVRRQNGESAEEIFNYLKTERFLPAQAEMKNIYYMLNDAKGKSENFHDGFKTSSIEGRGRYGYFIDNIEFELNIVENHQKQFTLLA